ELFRGYLEQEGDDPRVRRETARAYFRLAGLYLVLNKSAEAEAACRKAIDLQTRLVADFPGEPDYRHELCQSHNHLGLVFTVGFHGLGIILFFSRNRPAEAAAAVKRGRELLLPAGRAAPASAQGYRWVVTNVRLLAAQLALRAGRPEEAESEARQVVAALE